MDNDQEVGRVSDRSATESESPSAPTPDSLSTDAEEYEAARAAEFAEDSRRVASNLIFLHLEATQLQQGKGRRQVSGICGQLMRSHAELALPFLRARLEPRLPAASCTVLDAQLALLRTHWRRDLLPNDRQYLADMGTLEDPTHSRLEQYFCMLLQADCVDSGLTVEASKMIQDVICRYTRNFLRRRFVEFCVRSLSRSGRRRLLEWAVEFRLHSRRFGDGLPIQG